MLTVQWYSRSSWGIIISLGNSKWQCQTCCCVLSVPVSHTVISESQTPQLRREVVLSRGALTDENFAEISLDFHRILELQRELHTVSKDLELAMADTEGSRTHGRIPAAELKTCKRQISPTHKVVYILEQGSHRCTRLQLKMTSQQSTLFSTT